jgi:hypothetical protein
LLSSGDDYPIHQTPDPVALAGTDRNFYDRYFFNGYTATADVYFAAALGVYPQLNIMDAAFSVVVEGRQLNLHASRILGADRMDTRVGPIEIRVLEPLRVLQVLVDDPEHGVAADLVFRGRSPVIGEPRYTRRTGTRVFMDMTRMTQNGHWSGAVTAGGRNFTFDGPRVWGTRDRSWGIRPVGAADPQPVVPESPPQFFWLWAPLNFDDRSTLFHVNDDADGRPWNTHAVVLPDGADESAAVHMVSSTSELDFLPGSRHLSAARLSFADAAGAVTTIDLEVGWKFWMRGIGYGDPDWSHGAYKGPLAVGYDEIDPGDVSGYYPPWLHHQGLVTATMVGPDGATTLGAGILEQLLVGPHAPSGLTGLLDPAS